jgi:alpha-D-xyloside xylohydrolase
VKQSNDFAHDMIDLDVSPERILYLAARDVSPVQKADGSVEITIPFQPMRHNGTFAPLPESEYPRKHIPFRLAAYGKEVLRFSGGFSNEPVDEDSIMLNPDKSVRMCALHLSEPEKGIYTVHDDNEKLRARISVVPHPVNTWSDLQRAADPMVQIEFLPDGNEKRAVKPMSYDHFFPGKLESVPFGCTADNTKITGTLFSLHADPNEHFYGTGERFSRLDLAGKTITLENTDALGTASRKAYKNVPFYLSSAGYGVFIHSSAHIRLSFADISNRAVQGLIDDTRLDLFLIGGGTPERVIRNYRGLTGFSPELPLWSYGMWMSRMTYFSADEVERIADRLREESYPCDVIHLDSGYFSEDWVCDWAFSPERFPEPKEFIRKLRDKGFHISVWQTPNIGKDNPLYPEAKRNGYLPALKEEDHMNTMSDFSGQDFGGQIDFTYEPAAKWYKKLLRGLLDLGVECIKTDFGEKILLHADFKRMSGERLHNIYSLLYQKAAFETTAEYADKPFIWGRSCWAGGQRYPLHWGGDTSATWDGLASSLRGGLQFGLSGYTFWSHDIPGFHGLPEFMNSWPSETLYMRWTQFGVFTSHMRYHGSTPREPWEFPETAGLVRSWLRLRYALIPYILQEAAYCTGRGNPDDYTETEAKGNNANGRPMMSPLLLDYSNDPNTWHIDDQYLFGRDLLVAPIMNDEGIRDIYLPEGDWFDLYTGKVFTGGRWLLQVLYPLAAFPVFVRSGAVIPYYPDQVNSTAEMDLSRVKYIQFLHRMSAHQDDKQTGAFNGLVSSPLGKLCGFSAEEIQIGF